MDDKTRCPHCGEALMSPEPVREPASEQPTLEGKERSELRGLSVVSFLSVLGFLLLPVGLLTQLISLRYGCTSIPAFALVIGGLTLIVVGTVANNIIVWRFRRARGADSKLALAALILSFVGILAVVGAILVPVCGLYPDDGYTETRALGDCRSISTAALLFHKDTGTWPMFSSSDQGPESRLDYLYGNLGDMPQFREGKVAESWGTRSQDVFFQLVTNGKQEAIYSYGPKSDPPSFEKNAQPKGWDGPYLAYVTDDPWGYAYLISVSGFEGGTRPGNHVWCLSAGPNGIVDTPAWATEVQGDDIGYRTK